MRSRAYRSVAAFVKNHEKAIIFASFCVLVAIVVWVILPDVLQAAEPSAAKPATDVKKTSSGPQNFILNVLAQALYYTLFSFAGFLAALAGGLLDIVARIQSFDVQVVQVGWKVVRDICNMGFILILLVIAFGTIFRVQAYSAKQLLPKLIIGALLINFSKTICFVIINLSQVVMNAFIAPFGFGSGAGLASKLDLQKTAQFMATGTEIKNATDITSQMFLGILFGTVFLFVAAFVFFVYAIVLIVRVTALWILVTLSPLAFVLNILPGRTAELARKWWSEFMNQVLVGPAVAFFLYLALISAQTVKDVQFAGTTQTVGDFAKQSGVSSGIPVQVAGNLGQVLSFIFVIAFLWGGMIAAKQMSGATTNAVLNFAKRQKDRGKRMSKWGARQLWNRGVKPVGGLANRKLNPFHGMLEARKRQAEAKKKYQEETAVAKWGQRMQNWTDKTANIPVAGWLWQAASGTTPRTAQQKFSAQNSQMAEQYKLLQDGNMVNLGQLVPLVANNAQSGDVIQRRQAQAAMMMIAQNGLQEQFTAEMTARAVDSSSGDYNKQWAKDLRKSYLDYYSTIPGGPSTEAGLETVFRAGDLEMDPAMFGNTVKAVYGHTGKGGTQDTETQNLMARLDNIAFSTGKIPYTGMTGHDADGNMTIETNAKNHIDRGKKRATNYKIFQAKAADQAMEQLRPEMLFTRKVGRGGVIENTGISSDGQQLINSFTTGHAFQFKGKGSNATKQAMQEIWKNTATRPSLETSIDTAFRTSGNKAFGEMVASTLGVDITIAGETYVAK